MSNFTIINGTTGLNNKVDPTRLKYDPETGVVELSEAVNCDIDDTGAISRRAGQEKIYSSPSHSGFCDGGDAFAVVERTSDAAIFKLNTDFSLSGVRSGLNKGLRVSFCQVGGKTYYSNTVQNGVISGGVSSVWPVTEHVGANTTRAFYPAPLGHLLGYYRGRMLVAVDNVIFISEEYAPGKFDLHRRYWALGSRVVLLKPVHNGIWVSDLSKTYFIYAADTLDGYSLVKKSDFPAHEWSANNRLVDLQRIKIGGMSAVWSSDDGQMIGTEDGQLINYTVDRLDYLTGSSGATVVCDLKLINTVI